MQFWQHCRKFFAKILKIFRSKSEDAKNMFFQKKIPQNFTLDTKK